MKEEHILVLSTCPDDIVASRIATALVSERLAACVNRVTRVVSTYWWKGELVTDTESLILVKTTRSKFESLSRRLQELHPYEVPEVVALPLAAGSERYLAWISQSVAPGGGPS